MHPEIARLRADLRRRRYSPFALAGFFAGSWTVSWSTARMYPATARMWRRRALGRAVALPLVAVALGCRPSSPALWTVYAWQQLDLYWHLGLNHGVNESVPRPRFPLAVECTLPRAYAAAALWTGSAAPRWALTVGVITDLLDGRLARRYVDETALGALLDGEYDALLLIAAARAARRSGGLERAAERIVWLRFGGIFAAGLIAYFTQQRPATPGSTWPGKLAGAAQVLLLGAALSSNRVRPALSPLKGGPSLLAKRWVQVVGMALSTTVAVLAQVVRYRSPDRT